MRVEACGGPRRKFLNDVEYCKKEVAVTMDARDNVDQWREPLVQNFLAKHSRERPDALAVVGADRRLTWRELALRSDEIALRLLSLGVSPGDRVALLMRNRVEFIEAVFGALKIGAVVVPLNFRLVSDELDFVVRDAEPRVLISDREGRGRLAALPQGVIHLACELDEGLSSLYTGEYAGGETAQDWPEIDPHDLAFILYTSGTTGRPKGAMLTHFSVWTHAIAWLAEGRLRDDDVWLCAAPMFHAGGVGAMVPMIVGGITQVISPSTSFDARAAIDLLAREKVTVAAFVPTQWQEMCAVDNVRSRLPLLRCIFWGGAPAPMVVLEALSSTFPDADIISSYGQTEMGPTSCWLHAKDAVRKMGSVGKPVGVVELEILDDDCVPVADGSVGEVAYRGPTVFAGYWRNDAASAEAFRGGWFHSGDLARRDEEGFLYLVDRKSDMIVSGGENIYPKELEEVIRRVHGVIDVAVVKGPHERWHETPVAYVVADDHLRSLGAKVVLDACVANLASYKKPSAVVFVDSLPRNASGKVLKRELRIRAAQDVSGTDSQRSSQ
ncbi:acyl--CoA ligase [Tsukamurella asaccharolytica]|uniref:Acyl--CoA ligase n=1 Tax=Tsukamurella asaccharolytica TaxID=2592067 RepID=A0A5C5R6K5_9ACTN|nr:class I adenylate-forming enzyme family protein [Tsukamurella asaccharolytica]TWS18438.1 acyl--CoA ligase [Tsukamurella asaccharolytica]